MSLKTITSSLARRTPSNPQLPTGLTVRVQQDPITVPEFRRIAWDPAQPLVLRHFAHPFGAGVPLERWFHDASGSVTRAFAALAHGEVTAGTPLPYELHRSRASAAFHRWLAGREDVGYEALAKLLEGELTGKGLSRFHAPLALFAAAAAYNREVADAPAGTSQLGGPPKVLERLYIAQAPITDLPAAIQADLPPPELVRQTGRGDVYGTSAWLGLEPTNTPWHRDPNPNLFCQWFGVKHVRLLPPERGAEIYEYVRARVAAEEESKGRQQGGGGSSAALRGDEMLEGREQELLDAVVWNATADIEMQEATLRPGQALFIPRGWWHSIRSQHGDPSGDPAMYQPGRVNFSTNWWFR
jgi:hypothetical protein